MNEYNDAAPWEEPTINQENVTMKAQNEKQQSTEVRNAVESVDTQAALAQIFGGLSEYPLQNVMQRTMQSLTQQIGNAQHFADRVELGDEAVADAGGHRPSPDQQPGERRSLSEKQQEIIMRCADDEAAAVDALIELKTFYVAQFGEQPQYSLKQDSTGAWHPIQDFQDAVAHEYRQAHIRWENKNRAPADGDSQVATQTLVEERRKRAQSRSAQL